MKPHWSFLLLRYFSDTLSLFSNLWQENYINYRPSSAAKDSSGVERMNLIARAAESIGNGDIINVQIRKHRQWQLSQSGSLSSSIIPYVSSHQRWDWTLVRTINSVYFHILIFMTLFLISSSWYYFVLIFLCYGLVLLCCAGKGKHLSR